MLECSHPLPEVQILAGRQGFLLAACAGKSVLHVGCVDSGLAEERFARGELMHQRLATVARQLWGTDVDAEGVRFLLDQGFDHVVRVDLSREAPGADLASAGFDVIVLGEVLEHLPNPGKMLTALRGLMEPGRTRLIVTVPNAFSLTALLGVARGVESVHPDHNFYFSRTTLRTLIAKSGLWVLDECVYLFDVDYLPSHRLKQVRFFDVRGRVEPREIRSSVRRLLGRLRSRHPRDLLPEIGRTLVKTVLYHRTPYWADGLLAVCARDDDARSAP
jgi:2-polyprenyl-3-methyl-5-hydroxy-6-metoxy-1,4-benzoquinol methylase